MNCVLLSNVNIESVARRVEHHRVHVPDGYGTWLQELADPSGSTWRSAPDAVFVILDGAQLVRGLREGDGAPIDLEEPLAWVVRAAERSPGVKLFVSTVDIPPDGPRAIKASSPERNVERAWQEGLARLSAEQKNVYSFELKTLVEEAGRAQFYSSKRWYLGGLRFSIAGEKIIAGEIERILATQTVPRKKCLILDLDNTLWGGVVGEDGLSGIVLSETGEGARYKDFQRRIARLRQMGVVLGIVSKNNADDVWEVFTKHPDMVLKKDDFTIAKIDWSPKAERIGQIAEDLDLSIDSCVYIDDDAVERAAVRTLLPDVIVPEFPADSSDLPAFMDNVYRDFFYTLECTDEDRARTEMYLANARRAAERAAAPSHAEFLASLGTRIVIRQLTDYDVARAAQLTQKTNQFNLTTHRYSEQELEELRTTPGVAVFVASVVDKYGDNGTVLLAIVRIAAPDTAEMDTLLMSCRVMGRHVEDQILDHLVLELRRIGVRTLRIRFVPTRKNAPAGDFLERLSGGRLLETDDSGGKTWEYDITTTSPVTTPAYAELVAHPGDGGRRQQGASLLATS